MRLLILGGTRFLGRALVDAALAAGHDVTLFNRGQSNPGLYRDLEQLTGDRDGGLQALEERKWDAVIDTCGYVPRLVRASAELLRDNVDHYVFISSLSVYADNSRPGMDESTDLGTLEDETVEEITGETYGPLKVLCELAATEAMDGRALLVRSGLIVGPYDPSDRFTYWPHRVARGGETLAPGEPDGAVQFIDVRDIAGWTVRATEQRLSGPYNVTGPATTLTMGQFLNASRETVGGDATFTWVSDEFLVAQDVAAYMEMPLWVPAEYQGFGRRSIDKALAAGLGFRPLPATIADTLAWSNSRPADYEWRGGLTPEREQALLAQWHAREASAQNGPSYAASDLGETTPIGYNTASH